LSEEIAYAMLRKTAMNENKKIAEVAQSVITAAELFQMTDQMVIDKRCAIGFIRLSTRPLIVAVDKGLHRGRRLDIDWSARCRGEHRDKLNIGCSTPRISDRTGGDCIELGAWPRQGAIVRRCARRERQRDHGVARALCLDRGRSRRQCHRSAGDGAGVARVVAISQAARS